MKTPRPTLLPFVLFTLLLCGGNELHAQGTAFTYQGRLTENASPANGSYDLRFILFDAEQFGFPVGPILTNGNVAVSGGLFAVTLDFGTNVFTGAPRWLEIGVRSNGAGAFTTILPRQLITPAPYAIAAGSVTGIVPDAQLSANIARLNGSQTFGGQVQFSNATGSFGGNFSGNGAGLTNVDATTLGGVAYSNFWRIGGNTGIAANWYLGTLDYQPLELRVNNARAIRIEPANNGWPNLIGGAPNNYIEADVSGAIVAGGVLNGIKGNSGGVAIGGGRNNLAGTNSAGSVIGGGQWNQLGDGSVRSVISGGYSNRIRGFDSTNAPAVARDITDGTSNTLLLGETVGNATIGGGYANTIGFDCVAAVIGGGQWNLLGDGAVRGFIGGGSSNAIVDGTANTIIAGEENQITGGNYSVLGGGRGNTIRGGTSTATIGGGGNNVIDSLANNTAATIAGGARNWITNAGAATIGGGFDHKIQDNSAYATIAGGVGNTIETNAGSATIGGGSLNTIQIDARRSTIGGGERNTVLANARSAVIGGGVSNIVGGVFATVPGGDQNAALGDYSFAAGRWARASHVGAFVWADSANANFASTGSNQFLIRAAGGVGIGKTNPAAALDVNGTVVATIFQGSGLSLSNVNATTLGGLAASNFWQLGGNAGTAPGTHFLGTTDNQALELRVNRQRALRIEPSAYTPDAVNDAPNVIGGASINTVGPFTVGATIGGGGASNYFGFSLGPPSNAVFADFGTVGGGRGNAIAQEGLYSAIGGGSANAIQGAWASTIAGGWFNTIQSNIFSPATIGGGSGNTIQASADNAVISGGAANTIETFGQGAVIGGGNNNSIQFSAARATIGGGAANIIQWNAQDATIGGGFNNLIQTNGQRATISGGDGNVIQTNAVHATIGGGFLNTNAGRYATIPGGRENRTGANHSFAAGFRAKANHVGTFVWADAPSDVGADFASSSSNQFLLRASGGVGVNTTSPVADLHVNGPIVIQGALTPGPTASSNLLNLLISSGSSSIMTNGSLNGISFYESAAAKAMSLGYDGSGSASQNALRIYHSSDLPLFTFEASGELGINTTTPATALHVKDAAGAAEISIESSDAGGHRWTLQSSGITGSPNLDASFQIIDRTLGGSRLLIGTNGNVGIGTSNPSERLHVIGNILASGTITPNSDRNAKTDLKSVDTAAILERVARLPIQQWRFKAESEQVKHVGPMAQDFRAAFGLGAHETAIATVDADGVALAAIQGLNQKVEEQRAENAELKQRLAALEEIILNQKSN